MTFMELRELFVVLEQQRVSKDAYDNLGKPSADRGEALIAARKAEQEAQRNRIIPPPQ